MLPRDGCLLSLPPFAPELPKESELLAGESPNSHENRGDSRNGDGPETTTRQNSEPARPSAYNGLAQSKAIHFVDSIDALQNAEKGGQQNARSRGQTGRPPNELPTHRGCAPGGKGLEVQTSADAEREEEDDGNGPVPTKGEAGKTRETGFGPPPYVGRAFRIDASPLVARELLDHAAEAELDKRFQGEQAREGVIVALKLRRKETSHQKNCDEPRGAPPHSIRHGIESGFPEHQLPSESGRRRENAISATGLGS